MEEVNTQQAEGGASAGTFRQSKGLVIGIAVLVVFGILWFMPLKKSGVAPAAILRAGCGAEYLSVETPVAGGAVSQTIEVKATVDNRKATPQCSWTVFEAQAGVVQIRDAQGAVLGQGMLTTQDDWMTSEPVHYTGSVVLSATPSGNVTLVVTEENPSGEGTPDSVTLPLVAQ